MIQIIDYRADNAHVKSQKQNWKKSLQLFFCYVTTKKKIRKTKAE